MNPGSSDARARVFEALARAASTYPEDLPDTVDDTGLDPRDGALAHTIIESTVRHWLSLEFLLDQFLRTPCRDLEPALQGVLLGGAAQIVTLDRVPVHAAIDTSVEWAKVRMRPGAGSMANAVLRRIADLVLHGPGGTRVRRPQWTGERDELAHPDGGSLVLARAILPEPAPDRLGAATGTPRALLTRWHDRFGPERARELALHGLVHAPTVLNIAHARSPIDPLATAVKTTPHAQPGSAVADAGRRALTVFLNSRPDVWVQDAGSAMAVRSVAHLAPSLVLDLCAGRGTKTRQLALTFPKATVVACDPDPPRARLLAQLPSIYPNVHTGSPDHVRERARARADLILLDVPCSNTGVLARRPAAKHRCSGDQLARLCALQREIVGGAVDLLAPGGRILYSTCSLDDEENGALARAAAAALGLTLESELFTQPAGLPGEPASGYRDGSYSAVLARRA